MSATVARRVQPAHAKRARRVLTPFREGREYTCQNFDDLVERYKEEWVAIHDKKVVAHNPSRHVLQKQLTGHLSGHAYTTFLTRRKQTLIL